MKRQNVLNKKKKKKGFTLIELIIVMAILAILAVIAIPKFASYREAANKRHDITSARTIANAAGVVFSQGSFSGAVTDVKIDSTDTNADAGLIEDLLQDIPKSRTGDCAGKSFLVSVTLDGDITVSITDGTNTYEAYPDPDTYLQ